MAPMAFGLIPSPQLGGEARSSPVPLDVEVAFLGRPFRVVGILEPTGTGIDKSALISMGGATEVAPVLRRMDQISVVLVKLDPGADLEEVARAIAHTVPEVTVLTTGNLVASVMQQIRGLLRSSTFIAAVIWLMSVLMIGSIFSAIVNERRREIGLLRAMGATRSFVFQLILLEASLITGLGGALGVICGLVIVSSFSTLIRLSLGIPYLWVTPLRGGLLVVTSLLMACVTGAIGFTRRRSAVGWDLTKLSEKVHR